MTTDVPKKMTSEEFVGIQERARRTLDVYVEFDPQTGRMRFERVNDAGRTVWDWWPDSTKRTAFNPLTRERIQDATAEMVLERFVLAGFLDESTPPSSDEPARVKTDRLDDRDKRIARLERIVEALAEQFDDLRRTVKPPRPFGKLPGRR